MALHVWQLEEDPEEPVLPPVVAGGPPHSSEQVLPQAEPQRQVPMAL